MLGSFRTALANGAAAKRILLLGGTFFLIFLFVDALVVNVLAPSARGGMVLMRRSLGSYLWLGIQSLAVGVGTHYVEEKTAWLSFESSE